MERLTKWNEPYRCWDQNHDNDTLQWRNGNNACMTRLAAYEDLAMTPDEVADVVKERDELRRKYDEARRNTVRAVQGVMYLLTFGKSGKQLSAGNIEHLRRIAEDKEAESGD